MSFSQDVKQVSDVSRVCLWSFSTKYPRFIFI